MSFHQSPAKSKLDSLNLSSCDSPSTCAVCDPSFFNLSLFENMSSTSNNRQQLPFLSINQHESHQIQSNPSLIDSLDLQISQDPKSLKLNCNHCHDPSLCQSSQKCIDKSCFADKPIATEILNPETQKLYSKCSMASNASCSIPTLLLPNLDSAIVSSCSSVSPASSRSSSPAHTLSLDSSSHCHHLKRKACCHSIICPNTKRCSTHNASNPISTCVDNSNRQTLSHPNCLDHIDCWNRSQKLFSPQKLDNQQNSSSPNFYHSKINPISFLCHSESGSPNFKKSDPSLSRKTHNEAMNDAVNLLKNTAPQPNSLNQPLPNKQLNDDPEKFLCNWDSCKVEIPEFSKLLDHIKKDHVHSFPKLPQANDQYQKFDTILEKPTDPKPFDFEMPKSQQLFNLPPKQDPESHIQCEWENCDFNTTDCNLLDSHLLDMHTNPTLISGLLSPQPHCHGDCEYSSNLDFSLPQPSSSQFHTHDGSDELFCVHDNEPCCSSDTECQHQHALANGVTMYQCEWKSCKYQSSNLDEFMSHVRKDHVVGKSFLTTSFFDAKPDPQKQKKVESCDSFCINSSGLSPINQTVPEYNPFSLLQTSQAERFDPLSPPEPVTPVTKPACNADLFECNSKPQLFNDPELSPGLQPTDRSSCLTSTEPPKTVPVERHTCRWLIVDPETGERHECGLDCSSPASLSTHITSTHVGSRKSEYTCLWANCPRHERPFTQRQKIVRHLQTHTKNRPFLCLICGNAFAEEAVLKQHLRVHSGERPFECRVCGKRFAASTALSVHLRTHTGEKPLCCKWPGCNKRFSESSNLAKHLKTHLATRPYACTYPGCVKKFGRNDQLQRHFKTHSKENKKQL